LSDTTVEHWSELCYIISTNKSTVGRKKNKVEDGKMRYADFFAEVKGKFLKADVSDIKEHLAYQFNITGEAEGIFYVELKDGKLYVEPYEYFDRDAMFTGSADIFLKIAEGKLDPIKAVEAQELKVEGNITKALKLKNLIESRG